MVTTHRASAFPSCRPLLSTAAIVFWDVVYVCLEEKTMITSRAITGERLVNVLQSIALKQLTGRLSIEQGHEQGGEKGEIFFAHGNTVFARTRNQSGETALFTMLHWHEIQCAFAEGVEVVASTITLQHRRPALPTRQSRSMLPIELVETRQTPAIGMPAIPKSVPNVSIIAPRVQSHNHLSTRPFPGASPQQKPIVSSQSPHSGDQPGMHTIFRALPSVSTPKIIGQMQRKDRIIFLLLDGKRPLSTIRHLVNRSEADIAHTINHLLRQGYIEYIQG